MAEQIFKRKDMKQGTFGVIGEIDRKVVDLRLVLCKQKNVLRAVPSMTSQDSLMVIVPGEIAKEKFADHISEKMNIQKEEVLNALPSGSFHKVK